MTSKELVINTLEFRNKERVARQLWTLPWAKMFEAEALENIQTTFPDDIIWDMPVPYNVKPKVKGDPYEVGEYIDEWGCRFTNVRRGYIGEIKSPIIKEENWEDANNARFPEELLDFDIKKVNEFCANTDKFVIQTDMIRPFERLQFIRGTPELFMDIALENEGMLKFMKKLHEFNCAQIEKWAKTDVDALFLMDDWGTQRALLIDPKVWIRLFKPIYSDYCAIARKYGKKVFMHSDGHTLAIIPHLIEIGVDAVNLQIFCIGLDNLRRYKGKLTFWGEIDRQWILPKATVEEVENAVNDVYEALWENGGCIAQCEFGPGARPENIYKVFESWNNFNR